MIGVYAPVAVAVAVACTTVPAARSATLNNLAGDTPFRDVRAVWMSRFEFSSTQTDIRNKIAAAANAGFTDVYFQVRGQGDVLYPSTVESWDRSKFPTNPSFDPLQVAINEARAKGIKLHAWLNSAPMWRDTSSPYNPPADPNHFYNRRPDLRAKDQFGNDMPLSSGEYVGINWTAPDAATHLGNLAAELVTKYDLDGVHLDYIRNVVNGASGPLTYPMDPDTRARFASETGLNAFTSPNTFKQWVGDKLTGVVAHVQQRVEDIKPNASLTAAVWRDFDIGTRDYQQHADDWVTQGLLDAAFPMIYTADNALFRNNFLKWKSLQRTQGNTGIAFGVGSYLHSGPQQTLDQLQTARYLGANGYNIFSYGTLFSGTTPNAFGQALIQYHQQLNAEPDDLLPLARFNNSEDIFASSPTASGSNTGIETGTLADLSTEQAQQGTHSQKITIKGSDNGWFLRHLAGTVANAGTPAGNRELIAQGWIGFWLLTTTQGIDVSLVVDDTEGTGERGILYDVVADGQWHYYQWDLSDDAYWDGWVGGNGVINGQTVTLDSIQFFGAGDAVVYLDTVVFNPFGQIASPVIPEPAALALLAAAVPLLRRSRRAT